MMRKEKKKKQEFCQSRFYKDWNPDIMADYNRWCDNDDDDDDDNDDGDDDDDDDNIN